MSLIDMHRVEFRQVQTLCVLVTFTYFQKVADLTSRFLYRCQNTVSLTGKVQLDILLKKSC